MTRSDTPYASYMATWLFDAERRGRHSQTEFGNEKNGVWEREKKTLPTLHGYPARLYLFTGADVNPFYFINKLWLIDVLHSLVPKRVCSVIKVFCKSLYLLWCIVTEKVLVVSIFIIAHTSYFEFSRLYLLRFLLLYIFNVLFPKL